MAREARTKARARTSCACSPAFRDRKKGKTREPLKIGNELLRRRLISLSHQRHRDAELCPATHYPYGNAREQQIILQIQAPKTEPRYISKTGCSVTEVLLVRCSGFLSVIFCHQYNTNTYSFEQTCLKSPSGKLSPATNPYMQFSVRGDCVSYERWLPGKRGYPPGTLPVME